MKKWRIISELNLLLCEQSYIPINDERFKSLKCVCYAPNLGYRCWIFKYKGVPIALGDIGNGHYNFYSAVTTCDILAARLISLGERLRACLKKK